MSINENSLNNRIKKARFPLKCLLYILLYWAFQISAIAIFVLLNLFISGDIVYVADVASLIYEPGVQFILWISNSDIVKHDILGPVLILFAAIGLYSVPPGLITFAIYEHKKGKKYRRIAQGYCAKCDYDLNGNTSSICPECGTEFDITILSKNNIGSEKSTINSGDQHG